MIPNDIPTEKNYNRPIGKTKSGLNIYELNPKRWENYIDLSEIGEVMPGTQFNESLIGKKDRRILVEDNHVYPYYCMGLLISQFDIGEKYFFPAPGTATLITPNVIITCAHNVYSKQYSKTAQKIFFYPGQVGGHHLGEYQVKLPFIFPSQYKIEGPPGQQQNWNNADWAFLVLSRPVPELTPLPLIVNYPQTKYDIGIFGYPIDRTKNFLHGMRSRFTLNIQNIDMIGYELDTTTGQSGSAIIIYSSNNVIGIIGIHTTGAVRINYGNRITIQKYNQANVLMLNGHGHEIGASPRVMKQ